MLALRFGYFLRSTNPIVMRGGGPSSILIGQLNVFFDLSNESLDFSGLLKDDGAQL